MLSDARGYNSFDFTRGDEAFKSRFASEVRVNDSYVVEPSARRTVAVVAKRVAIKCAKSALTAVGMSRMNCQSTRDATVADGVAGPTWRRLARAGKVAAVSVTGRIWTSPRKILIYSATPVACEDVRETRAADVVSMTFDELLDKLASDPSWHPFLSAATTSCQRQMLCDSEGWRDCSYGLGDGDFPMANLGIGYAFDVRIGRFLYLRLLGAA